MVSAYTSHTEGMLNPVKDCNIPFVLDDAKLWKHLESESHF